MTQLVNPFDVPGRWHKANLHTHTTTSDGKATPPERVEEYAAMGYDVLAITDHRTTNDVSGLGGGRLLVISGIEYHPPCPATPSAPWHFVGLNVPHPFAFTKPDDAQACIDEVAAAGGISFLAHPFWCGQTLADFRELRGLVAMEVVNSTCDRCGRPSSETEWTNALDAGIRWPGLAVDDAHRTGRGEDVGECWTMLKMPACTIADVLTAIRTGSLYASQGPEILDFRVEGGVASVRTSPAAAIYLMSGPAVGSRVRATGQPVDRLERPVDAKKDRYVRAVAVDDRGRRAWSSPIWLNVE